jgi:phage I-like protein
MKINRLAMFDSREIKFPENTPRELPEEILLIKYGNNNFTKSGVKSEFLFSENDAENVINEFNIRGRDLVIDYEHQSLKGEKAPAAGWIEALLKTPEGLVAKIKYWTQEASDFLTKGEYRYFSPVIHFSRRGKSVSAIHSVALTNHPAMHDNPALVADDSAEEELDAPIKHINNSKGQTKMHELLSLLGLVALSDSPEEEQTQSVISSVKKLLDLKAGLEKLLESYDCESLAELEMKFHNSMPIDEKVKLENDLKKFEAEMLVSKALSDGKLSESSREWAGNFALNDLEGFKNWAKSAPKIIPDNQSLETSNDVFSTESLSDTDRQVFHILGLNLK